MPSIQPMALALACVLTGALADAQISSGEAVVIRKVGFPGPRVGERSACGQRQVAKGALSPDYFLHVVFGGFREGTCAQIGYTRFEEEVVVSERSLPWGRHNSSFQVYTRDPTTLDVAACIGRECAKEMSALGSSPYVKDAAHCISPAFGPCAPKAWDCLGDDVCRSALECIPGAAKTCGTDVWQVITDPVEREKVTCVWQCGNNTGCILTKCGKVALDCFTGLDPLCHKAAVCLPGQLKKCSPPAMGCFFSKDGICRENLACLANGANACADPAVNLLTDTNIAGVLTCANQRCPAPANNGTVVVRGAESPAWQIAPPSHYPEQLACMGIKCAGEVASLLGDKDVGAMATCLTDGLGSCGDSVWDCLGDHACQNELRCWIDSIVQDSSDMWKMVTDKAERKFDKDLANCISDCYTQHNNPLSKAFCIARSCGPKALKCAGDSTCRRVFTDLPEAFLKCSDSSLRDPKFNDAAKCAAQMAETCGRTGIELVRDQNLAKIVACNAQCTRPTQPQATIVI